MMIAQAQALCEQKSTGEKKAEKTLMNSIDEAKRLAKDSRYSDALTIIEKALASGEKTTELLLMKARLLQLVDQNRTLEEVEAALNSAILTDPHSVEALLEMGWFRLNVLDDPNNARSAFEAALSSQKTTNTEVACGLLKCNRELGANANREEMLQMILSSLVDLDRLKAIAG